jgi:hypothetical protein
LVDEVAAEEQAKRRIARAIATLPAIERYILLSYPRGATLVQTAHLLGRTPRRARAKLDAARRLLACGRGEAAITAAVVPQWHQPHKRMPIVLLVDLSVRTSTRIGKLFRCGANPESVVPNLEPAQ